MLRISQGAENERIKIMENKKFFGYKAAIGAFLVIFVNMGVASTLGVFIAQLAEFSGWSLSACVIIGTINTILNALLSLVAIPLAKKIGYRWMMLISIIAVALHVNMYCFAVPGQVLSTLIFFYIGGGLASVAIAFGTNAICSGLIAEWFMGAHDREKVTGAVTAGAGFGAAIWVFLAGQLFQYYTWQQCYRIITVIALVIGIGAVLFLIRTPGKIGQSPKPASAEEKGAASDTEELAGVTHKQALKSGSFWLLMAAIVCSVTACSAIISYAAAYWQGLGMSPTASSNYTAAYLVIAAASLLVCGFLFKKIRSTGYTLLTSICMIACMILFIIWGRNTNNFVLILIVITAGICYPIDAAFPGMVANDIFGPKEVALIIGNLVTACYIGQLLSSLVTSALLATSGGFTTLWTVFAIVSVAGMVLTLIAIGMSPMRKQEKLLKQNQNS